MSKHKRSDVPEKIVSLPSFQAEMEAIDLAACSTRESRAKLRYDDAMRLKVLPLNLIRIGNDDILTLVVDRTPEREDARGLSFACGCTVRFIEGPSSPLLLEEAIFIAYKGDLATITAESVPLLLRRVVEIAIAKGASDLVLIPQTRDSMQCSFRLDGRMKILEMKGYTTDTHRQVVNRVRVLGGVAEGIRDEPQDGRFAIPVRRGTVDVRFHIFPTLFGDKLCVRLPTTKEIPNLQTLGLSDETISYLRATMHRLEGAVMLSGPTGSGKTTTLYSIVSELVKRNLSIVSLEDPVEQRIAGISQTDLSRHKNISYVSGLKEVLRQDPDVILVGEVRDSESAKTALEAAATGHLVLSAVHGSGALSVVERLVRLSGDRLLVSEALSLVVSQRLLPKLCSHCKVIDCESAKHYGKTLYQPTQCSRCIHTGYRGRVLLDESIFFADELRQAIRKETLSIYRFHESPFFHGIMHSIERSLLAGEIDLSHAKKIIPIG